MEPQQLLNRSAAAAAAAGAKRKIDDLTANNNNDGGMGLRRTPTKSTPFVQVPSSRPPRWIDVEDEALQKNS